MTKRTRRKKEEQKMDPRGIEPRTTPMLREYYTTKPQAHLLVTKPTIVVVKPHSSTLLQQLADSLHQTRSIASERDAVVLSLIGTEPTLSLISSAIDLPHPA